jgi:hypothetical protein
MGCDIHTYIEIFNDKTNKWELAHGLKKDNDNKYEVPYCDRFTDRNYILFGILTNGQVRGKGYGIFSCKGIPTDCSDFVSSQIKYWSIDGHSHSYLTFDEIEKGLSSLQKIKISGLILKNQLKKVKAILKRKIFSSDELAKHLYPYCQGYSGNDINKYVQFDIDVPVIFEIDNFMRYINTHIYDWKEKNNIRLVFWFDN